jgi:integrase
MAGGEIVTTTPTMVALAEEYLAVRRKLGYALKIEGAELIRFAQYADRIGHRGPLTTELAVRWAKAPEKADPLYWARRLDMVRRFAKHRLLFDPQTEIPPEGLFGPSYRRKAPHIYTEKEIGELLLTASKLGPIRGLRPHTYVALFGLLASTGLRISEALALTSQDVDLQAGVLTIRAGKFKKSRLIPLHNTAANALRDYCLRRDQYHPRASSNAFFLTEFGTRLKYWRSLMTFLSISKKLGWRGANQRAPPRIHDLRHTFAVRTLLRWYERGEDIDRKILNLATYLGHVKVTDTYWYLTAVPELFALVGNRFETFVHNQSGGKS